MSSGRISCGMLGMRYLSVDEVPVKDEIFWWNWVLRTLFSGIHTNQNVARFFDDCDDRPNTFGMVDENSMKL